MGVPGQNIFTSQGVTSVNGGVAYNYRAVSTAGSILPTDTIVGVTGGLPLTLTLPLLAAVPVGFRVSVADEVGTAGTNNITISGNGSNIDGSSTKVINTNYGSYDLYAGTGQWKSN
jgi:hypothetical protein